MVPLRLCDLRNAEKELGRAVWAMITISARSPPQFKPEVRQPNGQAGGRGAGALALLEARHRTRAAMLLIASEELGFLVTIHVESQRR